MLAMDIPLSAMVGMVYAEAGRELIRSGEPQKVALVRVITLAFTAIVPASNVFYYMLGWPGWETNFMWSWVDNLQDQPVRAGFSHVLFLLTVLPAWLGFEVGRKMVEREQYKALRISYLALFALVGLVVLMLWTKTFNVAATYQGWQIGDTHSFWRADFAMGWAVTTAWFWAALITVYRWLRRQGGAVAQTSGLLAREGAGA